MDPNFGTNGFVYVFHTVASPLRNKVVRLTAVGDTGTAETVIIDNLPAADNHNGGNIHFGPDGKLYVTIGDTENSALSQDPSSLAGKILRYNSDGTIPVDNPTPGSAVYSLGLRNSFDFTFHPHSNGLWATENGTSVDDEVNLIVADGNYGWPTVTGIAGNPLFIDPIIEFTPTIAPTGIIAVSENSAYPAAYHDNLLFTDFNEGQVRRIVLSGPSLDLLGSLSSAYTGGQGSLIDLTEGPDGYIYVSTFTGIFRLVTSTSSTVVEVRVAGSSNDAEETPAGSINLTSSDLEFMNDGGTIQTHVGMRFANVTVPQGANILNAYLELTTDETGSSPSDVEFYAEDGDDATSFSSSAFDISSRDKTTASVAWSSIPAWTTVGEKHQSPDISTVIQEVVNRPGWASGNALAVLATSAGANNGPRTAESYNGSSANAALLHIEFTTGPDVIPPVRSNPQPTGTLSAGTTQTDISLDTNEDATCRHSTVPNTAHADMTDTFGVTGGTSHSDTVSGLADGGIYTFYAKCQDEAVNANTDDFAITFDISDGSTTIIEVRVGANKDDSEEKSSGANTYTSSDLEFMEDGGSVQAFVGMRWTNVTVPQGATIVSAYLELTTDETGSDPADVEFYAEASDNAVTFSSSDFDISSRAKTPASVVWANIPAWNTIGEAHQSTDISAIIQEVVNRPGWVSGNALAVLAASAGPNNGPRTAESYSGSAANAPLLHIEYRPRRRATVSLASAMSLGVVLVAL